MRELVLKGRGPNTLSLAGLKEAYAELEAIGDEPLLVRGDGTAFSAGLDLDALADVDPMELLDAIEAVARRLFLHPAPTVACVNGHAVAGGCLMVQCCDLRISSDDPTIRFGMTGVALGLVYPPLVLRIFRARLPRSSLERVLLGAGRFSPSAALTLGVVDELATDPLVRSRAVLQRLASHPAHAYAATKHSLRASYAVIPEEETKEFRERAKLAWDPKRLLALRK